MTRPQVGDFQVAIRGTSSTLLTFFDLMQIWAESNFNHQYIEFGSVYNLLKRRGNNFGKNHYAQIINDLYCLLGIKFTAKNAYWDNELKGYVDIILFRLFDHLDIIKCDCKNKNVSLFARIKVSDFLYNSIQKNSLLTVDFNSDFFHRRLHVRHSKFTLSKIKATKKNV